MIRRLIRWDERLTPRLRIAERRGVLRRVAAFLAHSGDSWFWFAGLAVVAGLGNAAWRALALVMAGSIFVLAVLVLGIKFTVRRSRPAGEWGAIYRTTDPHSFPSGHAARAALLAVLAWGLGPLWLAVALTLWAFLVAFARVAMGVHYFSDIVAGGFLGIAMGIIVLVLL